MLGNLWRWFKHGTLMHVTMEMLEVETGKIRLAIA